ncbi:hypothetical protein, conserved [Eimeria tenella]|uniref:Uncharacterized protein n=1 Tax=Eimeria tenella TaxID=5802 RepID=U6L0N2_EIMTE|nr:hypothetical protein, conserved [Eimeria tenella]CDJ41325.1 hypothetical protein, conserved [Eimeria tenella]|eukprot:XP_013232075.1 hypothetical protein, conserved [Eimeria tenella]
MDKAFDEVLAGCVRRHGENWLWKPVRQCLRALHRRTLRDTELQRRRGDVTEGSPGESCGSSGCAPAKPCNEDCPEDVQLHSFEVWVPLCNIEKVKLMPLQRISSEESEASIDSAEEASATTTDLSEVLASLGSSSHVGEPSSRYKDLCLVAGEVGVSIGSVYTSLTAFTDADSAGTAQLAATRLLLSKSGYELLDLGMQLPYKESLGAKAFPRSVFLRLFRRLRERHAAPLEAVLQYYQGISHSANEMRNGATERAQGGRAAKRNEPQTTACGKRSEELSEFRAPEGFIECRNLLAVLGGPHNTLDAVEGVNSGETAKY